MEIIRGRLSAADFSNPSQRYNADTDTFQYTPDNGANWYNSPEADPRHSNIFRLPPLETADPRCDAAANMTKWIKDFIDNVISSLEAEATALALTNNFLTTFATLFPPALLLLLLQEAATSLFDTGATALDEAFTSTQYDLLQCAFFCNIEDDGTVTAEDYSNALAQIASTMDTVPAVIVAEILFIQGEVGLSNAGVIGGETGDCDDCDCGWCHTEEVSISATVDSYGCYAGTCYVTLLYFQFNMPTTATITHLEVEAEYTCGSAAGDLGYKSRILVTSGVDQSGAVLYNPQYDQANCDGNSPSTNVHFSIDGARYLQWLMVLGSHNNGSGTADGSGTITRWTIHGTGDNPYGDDNC